MFYIDPEAEARRHRPHVQTVTPPSTPLIALSDIRDHLGLATSDDDARLQALSEAAVAHLGQMLGFPVLSTTRRAWFDLEACGAVLRLTEPATSVTSITQYDDNDDGTPITAFFLDSVSRPARITIDEYASTDIRPYNSVAVEYVTGWSAHDVPMSLVHAALLLIGTWFSERADVSERNTYPVPFGVSALVAPHSLTLGV